jgi:hypothetical protein
MEPTETIEREYGRRVTHYENDEGLELLKALARRRGVTATALLRLLIREEAARVGVTAGRSAGKVRRKAPHVAPTSES